MPEKNEKRSCSPWSQSIGWKSVQWVIILWHYWQPWTACACLLIWWTTSHITSFIICIHYEVLIVSTQWPHITSKLPSLTLTIYLKTASLFVHLSFTLYTQWINTLINSVIFFSVPLTAWKWNTELLLMLTLLVAMSLTDRWVWIVSSCSRHQSSSASVLAASLSNSSSDKHTLHNVK